jgi:hypothetical protein
MRDAESLPRVAWTRVPKNYQHARISIVEDGIVGIPAISRRS